MLWQYIFITLNSIGQLYTSFRYNVHKQDRIRNTNTFDKDDDTRSKCRRDVSMLPEDETFFLSCTIPARKVCVTRFIKPCPYSDTQKEWIPTKIYAVWFYTSCWTSQGVSIEKSTAHRHGRQRGQISAPFKWNDGHESHMESVKKVTQFNNLIRLYVIIIVWVLSVPVMLPFTDLNLRALDLVQ